MTIQNIIIVTDGTEHEAWGSLTEICRTHNFSYNYLKSKKMPFKYKGLEFKKVPFRAKNKNLTKQE